jgi:hypothetical protein
VRILFVTQYFTPEVGATQTRIHEFARACVAAGHEVTVLTEFPNHPHGRIPPEYRGRLATRERMDGFEVLRVWVLARPVKTFWTRLGFYMSFFALASLRGMFAGGRVDVVFATSPRAPAARDSSSTSATSGPRPPKRSASSARRPWCAWPPGSSGSSTGMRIGSRR